MIGFFYKRILHYQSKLKLTLSLGDWEKKIGNSQSKLINRCWVVNVFGSRALWFYNIHFSETFNFDFYFNILIEFAHIVQCTHTYIRQIHLNANDKNTFFIKCIIHLLSIYLTQIYTYIIFV